MESHRKFPCNRYRYRANPVPIDPDDELEQPEFLKLAAYSKSVVAPYAAQFLDYDIARKRNKERQRELRATKAEQASNSVISIMPTTEEEP